MDGPFLQKDVNILKISVFHFPFIQIVINIKKKNSNDPYSFAVETTQLTFTCSKSSSETLGKGVNYVKS